jgi:hypothetical protein
VSRADLVKGFVIAKNQYVLLDKQDIESVKLESRHARCNDASETVVPPERGWKRRTVSLRPSFFGLYCTANAVQQTKAAAGSYICQGSKGLKCCQTPVVKTGKCGLTDARDWASMVNPVVEADRLDRRRRRRKQPPFLKPVLCRQRAAPPFAEYRRTAMRHFGRTTAGQEVVYLAPIVEQGERVRDRAAGRSLPNRLAAGVRADLVMRKRSSVLALLLARRLGSPGRARCGRPRTTSSLSLFLKSPNDLLGGLALFVLDRIGPSAGKARLPQRASNVVL